MERYLITGATGFVGQELLKQLIAMGADITVLGRHSPDMPGVRFLNADITDADALAGVAAGLEFDYILHIASLPGDTGIPAEMMNVNVTGALNMLESARTMKIQRMVLVSSTSAYGWYPATPFCPPDYMPVDEEHPCRPKDMYAATKRMQEILASVYYHEYHVPVTCLRLCAVIGPDGRGGGRGWRTIAEQLAASEYVQIPHFSFEEQCHYVDIRDVSRMIIHASHCKNAEGEIFNCCAQNSTTGYEFEKIIHRHFPWIEVRCGFPWSMAQGDKIEFSMKKAREVLDFTPVYTLDDSVCNIKDWINAGGLRNKNIPSETFTDGIKSKEESL